MTTVLEWARLYVGANLSVIPIRADGSKAPALSVGEVEQYRERFPTEDELKAWFAPNKAVGVAVVCGKQSGNLAVLDFENDSVWRQWQERAADVGLSGVFAACPIVRTPGGGRHVYCRLQESWVAGGVLAKLTKSDLLIEVRGQGSYVLAPGSPAACHKLNKPYTIEKKGWLPDA
jgi:hypothetical protein